MNHVQVKLPYLDPGERRAEGRLGVRELGERAVVWREQVRLRQDDLHRERVDLPG